MQPTRIKPKLRSIIAGALTLVATLAVSASEPLPPWQQKLEQSAFSGTVLIAKSDTLIFQQSFGLADRENQRAFDNTTVFDIGSLTKQFTATAVMQLVEQGKLSLTATIDNYLVDVPDDKKQITIHHLLSNSSGLPTNPPNISFYDVIDSESYTRQVLQLPLVAAPGERYHYSNLGYYLLAQLIEMASGQNWEAYIQQHILLPAGLTATGYRLADIPQHRLAINYGADPNWLQRAFRLQASSRSVGDSLQHLRQQPGKRWFEGAGGFVSTAQDMQAWYLALQAGQILTAASWQQMFTPHIAENTEKGSYYGYGWAIDKQHGFSRINHTGSNGYSYATFDYYPEVGLFIFTASNDIDNYPYPLFTEIKQSVLETVVAKDLAEP